VSFHSLLHEIRHFYITKNGLSQLGHISEEVDADMFASCVEQLIIDNGIDIFKKLKDFVEEK